MSGIEGLKYAEVKERLQDSEVYMDKVLAEVAPTHIHASWDDLPDDLQEICSRISNSKNNTNILTLVESGPLRRYFINEGVPVEDFSFIPPECNDPDLPFLHQYVIHLSKGVLVNPKNVRRFKTFDFPLWIKGGFYAYPLNTDWKVGGPENVFNIKLPYDSNHQELAELSRRLVEVMMQNRVS